MNRKLVILILPDLNICKNTVTTNLSYEQQNKEMIFLRLFDMIIGSTWAFGKTVIYDETWVFQ
jgi:hypothetical protein